MSLESYTHTAELHKLGNQAVDGFRRENRLWYSEAVPGDEPQIPSPDLFLFSDKVTEKTRNNDGIADKPTERPNNIRDATTAQKETFDRLPTVAECATHLELLEVFYATRQNILASKDIDNAMLITPKRETKTGKKGDTKTLKDTTLWDRRQEKWNKYVEFACVRFLSWMDNLKMEDTIVTGVEPSIPKHLPPLDILMVWHSFLLNPKLFKEQCGKRLIWRLRFPWQAIHDAINNHDWTFELSVEDTNAYRNRTGLPPDLYHSFREWHPPHVPLSFSWQKGETELNDIKQLDRFSLKDARYIGNVNGANLDTFPKKALAVYCKIFPEVDNALACQLRDAVMRQATFVDKMNAHIWIRSPAVEGTIRRAIDRYDKFLRILALGKKFTIVPTLDVDLAWHTNQCYSGFGYASAMKSRVGRFINHDDTIAKETLGDGFGETRKLWRVYYGKEYRICGCWDCEALTSAIETVTSQAEIEAIAAEVERKVKFYRVCELKRRMKRPLPGLSDM